MHDLPKRLRRARRAPLFDRSDLTSVNFGRDAIERLLPHRGSMLLLDQIVGVDPAGRVCAIRTIEKEDPVFEGHFPNDPVYPGALQMEAIGQATLCMQHFLASQTLTVDERCEPRPLRLLRVIEASFLGGVGPGDQVEIYGELVEDNGYTFITIGQMLRGDEVVSVAAFEAMILEDGEEFE